MRWKIWIKIWRAKNMSFEPIMNPDMTPFGPWRWHQLAELVLCDKTRSWPQFSGQRKEVRQLTTSNYDPFEWQRHAIKRPPNMQAIFTSSQTWTLSNSVNSVKTVQTVKGDHSAAPPPSVKVFFRFVCHLHQTRPGLCQMSTTHLLLFIISSMLSSRQLFLFCTL